MPLQSRLFRGDPKLEAAAVSDPAHIVPGARGPHVVKIQKALIELRVAPLETDGIYGPATAAAVLTFKRQHNIVNYRYQSQPDNIVGRMTVAALDRELVRRDEAPHCRGCPDPVRSGGGSQSPALIRDQAVGEARTPMPGILSVLFQLVRVKGKLGPHSFALVAGTPKRANELLAPYGMRVAVIPGFSFEFGKKILWNSTPDLADLRSAAEAAMPGFDQALRVIVCPFIGADEISDDTTQNAISAGPAVGVPNVKNFVVLNANCNRADKGTLLHEMIHSSSDIGMLDSSHGGQPDDSIFSWGANRTVLRQEHARMLHKAPFTFRR